MPKQMYEGKGEDLAGALQRLYQTVFGDKASKMGEEARYCVDLIALDNIRYSSGPQKTYEAALDGVRKMVSGDDAQYRREVVVTAIYEAPQQAPAPSGAAPSSRRTADITGLL
ncbi:hypothetical protein J4210_06380 [Candidatus Woesearchaeota archaeon]|nr:hypothetical protein [Candidatus Woesearchaeota archaeon]